MASTNGRLPDIPEQYAHCKLTQNHWWKETTVAQEGRFFVQHMVCKLCGKERRWKRGMRTGAPGGNSYTDPPGYKTEGGLTTEQRYKLIARRATEAIAAQRNGSGS